MAARWARRLSSSASREIRWAAARRQSSTARIASTRFVGRHLAEVAYCDGTVRRVDTRRLSQSEDLKTWLSARAALTATASEFSCAGFDASPFLSRAALLAAKAGEGPSTHVDTAATRFGTACEPVAIAQYEAESGNRVRGTGLWTDETCAFGASPDGVVVDGRSGERGLLEVKCFWSKRRQRAFPTLTTAPSRFVAQIQGGLAVCDLEWCDLVCWIPKNSRAQNYATVRVFRDRAYWDDQLRPRLDAFAADLAERRAALATSGVT